MEELASLLFWIFGLSSYPLIFFLSLKKSVSLASRGNAASSKTLASLVAVYLESALLSSLIAYSFPPDWPPYAASLLALASTLLVAVYVLKSSFKLSFLKGALAFGLWQALSLALGGLLVVTVFAAMLETIFTFVLIIALILLALWMWSGKQSVGTRGKKPNTAEIRHLGLGESEKRIVAIAIIALLCSSLVVPSAVQYVSCEPQTDSTEREVEVEFEWQNRTVRANIVWNQTEANAIVQGEQGSAGQSNYYSEFGLGFGQGAIDTLWGIVNVPGALWGLHDAKAATTYLSLINDVTKLQGIMGPQKPLPPANCPFDIQVGKDSASQFVKDGKLASELADMGKKEYKCEVASDPDVISRAVDVEKYVDGVAWDSAFVNYFTLNLPLACETYQKVKAETGSEGEALWQAARIFGLTSPWLDIKDSLFSGDPKKVGNGIAKLAFTLTTTYFMLSSAYRMARGEGLLSAVTNTAYNLVMPGQALYNLLKGGAMKVKGAITAIRDVGLREALSTAMDNLAKKFSSTEYISFPMPGEDYELASTTNQVMTDGGGLLSEDTLESRLQEAYLKFYTHLNKVVGGRIPALKNQLLASKVIDRVWIESLIDEIDDFENLKEIGEGTAEFNDAMFDVTKGHWGEDYYELRMVDTGMRFRVYSEGQQSSDVPEHPSTISALYKDEWTRIDKTGEYSVKGVKLKTFFTGSYLEEDGFFEGLKIEQEVELDGAKGIVKENGEKKSTGPYVAIDFEVMEDGVTKTKRVQFSPRGLTVNDRSVIDIEIDGDAVYLVYQAGEKTPRTLISQPKTIPSRPTKWPEIKSLTT